MSPIEFINLEKSEIIKIFNEARVKISGYTIMKGISKRVIEAKMKFKQLQGRIKVWKGLYVLTRYDRLDSDPKKPIVRVVVFIYYMDRRIILGLDGKTRTVKSINKERWVGI